MMLANESLVKDRTNTAARTIQVRALIECDRGDEALEQVRRLVEKSPNQESLFLLARAANAASDQVEEISALNRLVALGAKDHQPLGASLTYLGQAYAKNGERGEALRAFQKAIEAPELSGDQRKMIKELMDHIAPEKR
jgi:tetratricopeptide (TPR) repeat protein